MNTTFEYAEEQLFLNTVKLEATSADGTKSSTGTGFLVQAELPSKPGHAVICLVTARHVLFDGEGLLSFRIHQARADDPTMPDLEKVVTVRPSTHNNTYVAHDDPTVDVAALNVSLLKAEHPEIQWRPITLDQFADFDQDLLGPTMQVVFVGYPVGLDDAKHALPILRVGHIATLPKVDFDGRPVFLIDAEVFPGSSGSPVLVNTGGAFKLAGLVVEGYDIMAKVEAAAKKQQLEVPQHLGIGVVFKVRAIREVVEKIIKQQG